MAIAKISDLSPATTPLTGEELILITQSESSRQLQLADLPISNATQNALDQTLTSETVTSLAFDNSTNILSYTDENSATTDISIPVPNDFVDSAAFDTANGDLTLTRTDSGTVTVNLDGRFLTDYTVTEQDVTQHEAALSITESQITDLQNYLTSETVTAIAFDNSTNTLSYTDENSSTTDIDLSLYLDDTNLARLTSGTLDGSTGVATFTRDDDTTFTVDFSPLFDDTNLARITSASFNSTDGVLTLTRDNSSEVTVDLDGRYLPTSGKAADAELLDGESGTYYLDYTNFSNTPSLYTSSDFNTDFSDKDTDNLSEGTSNLYYTDTRARNSVSASGDLSYDPSTGVFSFTETPNYTDSDVDAHLSGGTGVTYTAGTISIGQDVETSASVTFLDAEFTGTGAVELPEGTEAERPGTPASGMLRFNSDTALFEGYNGTEWSSVGGSTIANDTATTSDLFPLFADSTSGVATDIFTSDDSLLYKPDTGELKAEETVALNGLVVNADTVTRDYTLEAGYNAMSAGPVDVADGVTVTVSSGSRWVIV